MNLFSKLQERRNNPIRIGLIGAGKFAAMYLAQVPRTPGIRLAAIADLAPANARANLERVGWSAAAIAATPIVEDWQKLVADPQIDIVIESTGNPVAAVEHILGEALDDQLAFPVGHPVDPDDEAAGGQPAQMVVPFK